MANITLLGASYTDVPAVDLPKTGGGTVRFYEDEPSDLGTKTITLNGTYVAEDDSVDGYSEVTVNVQGGASMSEVQNQYGTELVITSAPGSAPSATRHTLYFEYEDETNETVYAYYDDALIGPAITATTPTTHNNKTVTLAQLDGTTWYSYSPSAETWETVWNSQANSIADDPYPYFWITELSDVYFTSGDVWRVTVNNDTYRCTAHDTGGAYGVILGNPKYIEGTDDGSDIPFCWYNAGWGALLGSGEFVGETTYSFKFERLVTS